MNEVQVNLVQCANNGGCGPCDCACHTDVADPGPHLPTCKFADDNYVPPDFVRRVAEVSGRGVRPQCNGCGRFMSTAEVEKYESRCADCA